MATKYNMLGLPMDPRPRKLNCDAGHDPCYCSGRKECHNCGKAL